MPKINNKIRFNLVAVGLFIFLFNATLNANCEPITTFPFTEDFEGAEFPPPCWTSYDAGGSGTLWERTENDSYSGSAAALHHWGSCNNNIVNEGWLVTPPLSIPETGNYMLKFWSYNEYPNDYYYNGVWIATMGHALLQENTPPCTSTFIELKQFTNVEVSSFWKEINIPLDAYAGQTIYIGFKYEGFCADAWYIDDVEVSKQDLVILTSGVCNGFVGDEYNLTLEAFGNLPITWTITDGNLPNGLNLSTVGIISGIPTTAGTYIFTVNAANIEGNHSKVLRITIGIEPVTLIELLANTTNVINYTLGSEFNTNGYTNNYVEGDESLGFRFDYSYYYAVAYKISLSAGNLIQIYSSIENGGSYLILYKADGDEYRYVTHDEDSGVGHDSYINILINDSGVYYMVLTNKNSEISGNYSINVTVFTSFSVSYNLNDGTGSTPTETNKIEGATFTAAQTNDINAPQGKHFIEWNTAPDGSGIGYNAGAIITMPSNDITLYAIWGFTLYYVEVFNGEGSGNYTYGETVYITAVMPTVNLYLLFKNWISTSPGVSFADANSESTSFTMPANDVRVAATFEEITGIAENFNHLTSVYPNPSEGNFILQFGAFCEYIVTISDISGKLLFRQTVTGQSFQMDISNYPAGVYLLIVENGKKQTTVRIVKK